MKKYAGSLRLDLAQFRELEAFAQMGTELDAATQKQLDRGMRLVEVLKQGQYVPMDVAEQVAIIFAATQGYLDQVPVENVKEFEAKLLKHLKDKNGKILDDIRATGVIGAEEELRNSIKKYVEEYLSGLK